MERLRRPLPFLLAALILLFLGERALSDTPRLITSGLGGVLLVLSIVGTVLRFSASDAERKKAAAWLCAGYAVCGLAVLLYLTQSDYFALIESGDSYELVLVAWPTILALGALPVIAMEMALLSMEGSPKIELARISRASRGALVVALGVVIFAGLNYVGSKWDKQVDLSYFKTSAPSESTLAITKTLTDPLEIVLFFPPGNDVLERVRRYIDVLATDNSLVEVQIADHALRPDLAKEFRVRANGAIGFRSGESTDKIDLDIELDGARKGLKKLDESVQAALLEVSRPPRVAYFTAGHDERSFDPSNDDRRLPFGDLRALFETQGFSIKQLGLADGLGSAVPGDATLVVVGGPMSAFLDSEIENLVTYLRSGGSLLVLVEPDRGEAPDEFLAKLGLTMSKKLVASEDGQVRVGGGRPSPYNFVTKSTSSHPTVESYRKAYTRLAFALLGAGALEKHDTPMAGASYTFTFKTPSGAWLDLNSNARFETGDEARKSYHVAAAIEVPVAQKLPEDDAPAPELAPTGDSKTAENAKAEPDAPKAPGAPEQGRAMVFSDVDAFADGVLRNPGNAYAAIDTLRWLAGEDAIMKGAPQSEEDRPLVHRKDEDELWFYGTTLGCPGLVLALGLFYTRRRRRRFI